MVLMAISMQLETDDACSLLFCPTLFLQRLNFILLMRSRNWDKHHKKQTIFIFSSPFD